ncbi:Ankyrin repeat and death domain-containing protein 1A [Aspergillus nanangensis]|uniref:Ankyrin repeat and death domain-containing protein 1A n=1 Tax=Aspergillus nanangensis TaxID=2582783 RepID=A0AAD4CHN4_ASPNN|nr:Ankyrin repeat and death domain-containing protein 1A [Aspergillus nanangensis]
MPINDLPPEILLEIVQWLDYASEMNSLACTNSTFYTLLNTMLYTKYSQTDDQFPLRWAASRGSDLAVRKLLAAGVEPSLEAMLLAITFGHDSVIALLHEAGVNINAEGKFSLDRDDYLDAAYMDSEESTTTALARAVWVGDERVMRLLLELGANTDCAKCSDYHRRTPMKAAARLGNASVIKLLIEAQRKGECPDLVNQLRHCLDRAASADDYASVQILLDAGATPGRFRISDHCHVDVGDSNGNFEVTQLLFQNGYIPTIKQLHNAMCNGKVEKLRLLMQWVDFPNLADDECSRAIVLASAGVCGNIPLVRDLVVSRGWNMNRPRIVTGRGRVRLMAEGTPPRRHPGFPLVWAALYGQFHVVQFLLTQGANPSPQAIHHRHEEISSLAAAIRGGNADIVSLLLDHGADPNTFHGGQPVLVAAIRNEHIFKILLDRGADLDIQTCSDNPLSSAVVKSGTAGVARLMCERGVNFDHPTVIADGGCDRGEYIGSFATACA